MLLDSKINMSGITQHIIKNFINYDVTVLSNYYIFEVFLSPNFNPKVKQNMIGFFWTAFFCVHDSA